jgi:ribosomal protein L11 methyltransferase
MSVSYVEARIAADGPLVDHLIGILGQIGFEGFWEDEGCLKAYMRADRWSMEMAAEVETTIAMLARSSQTPAPRLAVETIADRNWNEEWEKTIHPIEVTDRIVIRPSWHTYTASLGQIVLTIDPKMSFGTGYHESTRLVLRLMEPRIRSGMRVLDVGTGTGVLAIAAVRLGAETAVALDTDEWACHNALENISTNGVADRIVVLHSTITEVRNTRFDFILANIQRTIILEILADLQRRLHPQGEMILSGLLVEEEAEIETALAAHHLHVNDKKTENEWLALVVSNRR